MAVGRSRTSLAIALASPVGIGAIAGIFALVVLLPGLGGHGLLTDAELPVLDRTLASLGEPLDGLERSPWLPDALRTWSFAWLGESALELGIRLPHAIASALLVGLAAGIARSRGEPLWVAVLTAAFALAFPATQIAGRTVMGNPVGEVCIVAAIVLGLTATTSRRLPAWAATAAAAIAVAAAVSSIGLLLGGALPLCVIAATVDRRHRPYLASMLWLGFAVTAAITIHLMIQQQEGYIPLLGAAKDLELIEQPYQRRFAATLEDLGYQMFPWLPLALVGALDPASDRWPSAWLGLGIALCSVSGVLYGSFALPLVVPTALCCAASLQNLIGERRPPSARRFWLLATLAGMLLLAKDGERTPSRIGSALHAVDGERSYPADRLDAAGLNERMAKLSMLALILVAFVAPRPATGGRVERWLARIPTRARNLLPGGMMLLVLVDEAVVYGHILVPNTSRLLSPRDVLEHHASLVEQGAVPPLLGTHRVRDDGLRRYGYGGPERIDLKTRGDVAAFLADARPRAALLRSSDLAFVHQQHREHRWPLFVLDRSHADLVLVANVLPDDASDENPISEIVSDRPFTLAHETMVRFENYVEMIGWEVDEPLVRGSRRTLRVAFRVLRPPPAGTKIYMRFQRGKSSRINAEPHVLTSDLYPPNYWRAGDYVLHSFTFRVPVLEILSGPHSVVVGLRRGEHQNVPISIPEGTEGEYGVKVKNNQRTFAEIGSVEVY